MPRSRESIDVIEIEDESSSSHWFLWMLAGTAVGVAAGVLAAERFSGRRPSAHTLLRRVRGVSKVALSQWGPMLDLALELKDAWVERRAAAAEEAEEDEDEYLEDADEYEEADPAADDDEDDDADEDDEEFDEDLDEDLDDDSDEDDDLDDDEDEEEEDEDEDEDDDEDDEDAPEIGVRVLEAFSHDPILSERNIEIEADDDGVVLLHGSVHASREVSHAVTIAGGVPGVTKVRQRLVVRTRR